MGEDRAKLFELVRLAFHAFDETSARELGHELGMSASEIDLCCDGRELVDDGERLVPAGLN